MNFSINNLDITEKILSREEKIKIKKVRTEE
jgi:hypothetical protein